MSQSEDGRGYQTEQRILIRDAARAFTMKEVLPVANKLDGPDGIIPMELRQKMADMGYFGITIPEEYGGLGLGIFEYCLICEQLARGWMSVSGIINTHFIVAYMLIQHGTEEQKQRYLPKMVCGDCVGAIAMTEPGAGSDLQSIRASAQPMARAGRSTAPRLSSPTASTRIS